MRFWGLVIAAVLLTFGHSYAKEPVRIGLDAEYGLIGSSSAQAIEAGIRVALSEINAAGGVLGGRPLELVVRDNRSVPARSQENLRELAAIPDMVAVYCGRFSPAVLEALPLLHELKLPLLDPWASADGISENGYQPNYVFRLSLRDRWAMPAMMRHATSRGFTKVGLLLPNTGWGRSNQVAAELAAGPGMPVIVGQAWYNWGAKSLVGPYYDLLRNGAQTILFVANDAEAASLIRDMAAMPEKERRPLIMHWGVTGGDMAGRAGAEAMAQADLSVVQTFSFATANPAKVTRFMGQWDALFGHAKPEGITSAVGVAHAYDLTHLLAKAVDLAGSTDRAKVRDAMERLRDHDGLVRHYTQPFTSERHDALGPENVFMAGFLPDGTVVPLTQRGRAKAVSP